MRFKAAAARGTLLLRGVISNAIDDSVTSSGKYLARLAAGHALSLGWDGSAIRRSEARRQRDTLAGGEPYALDEDYTADVGRLALFAQDEWDVTRSYKCMRACAGKVADGDRRAHFEQVQTRSSVWSPVAQLLWKPPGRSATSCGWRWRAPTRRPPRATWCRAVTRSITPTAPTIPISGQSRVASGTGMGPRRCLGKLFWQERRGQRLGVARRISDVTVQRLSLQDGIWITSPFNNGVAQVRGVEMDVKLPLRTWWPARPRSTCAPTPRATGRASTPCQGRATAWPARCRPP